MEFPLEFCFGHFLSVEDPEPLLSESSQSGRETGSRETRAPSSGLPEGPGGGAGLRGSTPSRGDNRICSIARDSGGKWVGSQSSL